MAVSADNRELAKALQGALDKLAASGRLRETFARGGLTWSAP
jgi:ABC-type amino acid transport substrate-binding protein